MRYATLLSLTLVPLVAAAQPAASDVAVLKNKALIEGAVDVKVTTRPVADAASSGPAPTEPQRIAIHRTQHEILIQLVSRGLVVGNEISLQSDGSFTMRVLPDGIDRLATNPRVVRLTPVAPASATEIPQ